MSIVMIEIITTSVFVLSSIYGGPTVITDINISTTTAPGVTSRIEDKATTKILARKELEKKVKAYFKDDPILVDIARCESSFRQFDDKGNVLKGKVNKGDLGLMQINKFYHADKALELGFDLKTLEGNMAYAQYLYDKEGSAPWVSSSKCWKKNIDEKIGELVALNK
jgi:soluble lytic murein transglycosylase-like protein